MALGELGFLTRWGIVATIRPTSTIGLFFVSNYPPPNLPPQGPFGFDYGPPPPGNIDAMRPAQRASLMLWILGGAGAACGLCLITAVWVVPIDQLLDQIRANLSAEQQRQLANLDLGRIVRIATTVICILGVFGAAILLGTAGLVRRGNRAAIVAATVLCGLLLIWCALRFLVDLITLASGSHPLSPLVDFVFWAAVAGAAGATVMWLMQALGASKQMARQQFMQAQYWQYQQQQQAGYGYGSPTGTQPPTGTQLPPAPQNWLNLPPPPPPPSTPGTSGGADVEPKS